MKTIEGRYEDIQRAVYLCDLMLRLSVRLILDPKTKNKRFKWLHYRECIKKNWERLIFRAGDILGF